MCFPVNFAKFLRKLFLIEQQKNIGNGQTEVSIRFF